MLAMLLSGKLCGNSSIPSGHQKSLGCNFSDFVQKKGQEDKLTLGVISYQKKAKLATTESMSTMHECLEASVKSASCTAKWPGLIRP